MFLREGMLFLSAVRTLALPGCVFMAVMGNSREKTRHHSESHLYETLGFSISSKTLRQLFSSEILTSIMFSYA